MSLFSVLLNAFQWAVPGTFAHAPYSSVSNRRLLKKTDNELKIHHKENGQCAPSKQKIIFGALKRTCQDRYAAMANLFSNKLDFERLPPLFFLLSCLPGTSWHEMPQYFYDGFLFIEGTDV